LEILVACYVLKKQGIAFVLSDYKTILYHAQQWRKRLVHKKIKSLPAHGAKRPFMVPEGPLMVKNDPSSLWRAAPDWQFMERHDDQLTATIYQL